MILICEKCSTKYLVNQSFLLPNGKNVKCVKCEYIWFQYAKTHDKIIEKPIQIEQIPTRSALPVIIEINSTIWLKILPVFFFFMIIITSIFIFRDYMIKVVPKLDAFYNLINLPTTTNVKLESVSVVKNKDFININGLVINHSNKKRKVPAILITISDQEGRRLVSSFTKSPQHYLNPNEKYHIHKRIFNLPTDSCYVTIDLEDLFNIS